MKITREERALSMAGLSITIPASDTPSLDMTDTDLEPCLEITHQQQPEKGDDQEGITCPA